MLSLSYIRMVFKKSSYDLFHLLFYTVWRYVTQPSWLVRGSGGFSSLFCCSYSFHTVGLFF
jgi:hypothetical protein